MFYYIASVRFLNGNRTTGSKVYNYVVSYTIAQKILTALQYSASSSFKIKTSIGDTYRDAGVVFEDFRPCLDYAQARMDFKEIVQITPVAKATAPYCFNISDDRLKKMLDEDVKTYGSFDVVTSSKPMSRLTSKELENKGVLPPPIYSTASTGSTAAPAMGGLVRGGAQEKTLWSLFEETQERRSPIMGQDRYVEDKLVKSIEDSIKELNKSPIIADNPKPSKTIWTMTIPPDTDPRISINPKQKEKSTMFDNIMKDMYFGPYKNKDVRLSMQGMAVKTPEGRYNVYNAQTGALTDVTGFLMDDFGDVFYAIPVAQKDIKVGDVILHNKAPVIVTQIGATMISVLDPSRGEEVKKVPAKSFFGFDFYSKIINAMEGLMDTANADQPFGMLPMIMMMSDDGRENDPLKMVMMYQMMNGQVGHQMNPILMMALMGDKGGDNSMMKYIMMSEMMKSGGVGFGGMFGTPVVPDSNKVTAKAPDVKISKTNESFSQDRV